jgi:hypothetical protein
MATTTYQGNTFKDFVGSFAGTPMILAFAFKECECEHASRIVEVKEDTVRVVAFDDETGKPVGEGEFPWDSVVGVRIGRMQWDHSFVVDHDHTHCDHDH